FPGEDGGEQRLFTTIDLGHKRFEPRGLGIQVDTKFTRRRGRFESEVGLVESPLEITLPRYDVRKDGFGGHVGIGPNLESVPGPTGLAIVERYGPLLLQEIAPRDE